MRPSSPAQNKRTCRQVMATGTGGVTPSTSCSSKSRTKASSDDDDDDDDAAALGPRSR